MAEKRKKYNWAVEKEFLIVLAVAALIGLLSLQVVENTSLFDPLEVPDGFVAWQKLATTKENEVCTKDDEGFENCETKPEYSPQVSALSGKDVKLMGYMFPLMQGKKQKEFLLGPYPQSCPYHYHIGASQVVEVHSPQGVEFTYEPVKVEGTFAAEYNAEFGVFYYLKDAKLAE